jgi:hypothetical protein
MSEFQHQTPESDFEVRVEAFFEKLHSRQDLIEQYMSSDDDTLGSDLLEEPRNVDFDEDLADSITTELNSICPFIGETVLMGGLGVFPIYDAEKNIFTEEAWVEGVVSEGIYMGVNIITGTNFVPLISHKVVTGEIEYPSDLITVENSGLIFAYYAGRASTIFVVDELIDCFNLADGSYDGDYESSIKMEEYLRKSSKKLNNMLRDTRFRRMSRQLQNKHVEKFVEEVGINSKVSGMYFIGQTDYGFVTSIESGSQSPEIVIDRLDIDGEYITGVCLAVDSLQRVLLPFEKIKNDRQLLYKQVGLCLVVDPDDEIRKKLGIDDHQTVFLSLSNKELNFDLE